MFRDLLGLGLGLGQSLGDSDYDKAVENARQLAEAFNNSFGHSQQWQSMYSNKPTNLSALANQQAFQDKHELQDKVAKLQAEVERLKKDRFDLNQEERIDVSHEDWQRQRRELKKLDERIAIYLAAMFGEAAALLILIGMFMCHVCR